MLHENSPRGDARYNRFAHWERSRLDLTVEALISDNEKWHPLFSPDELAILSQEVEAI
jgi:hypothetical protein